MSHLRSPRAMIWPTLRAIEISSFGPQRKAHFTHTAGGKAGIGRSSGEKLAYRPQAEDLPWPFPRLVPFVTLLAHNRFHSGRNLARPEWVENSDVQLPEIRLISRGNDQLVNAGSSSNHLVLKQSIRFAIHDPAPLPKARCIHRQYLIRTRQLICPGLDVTRLRWILAACPLNACLQFAHRHGRQKQLVLFLVVEPSDHSPMRTRLSQFGHDIGI